MGLLSKHWSRIAVTLVPLVFALLHAMGVLHIGVLQRLDDIIYDARLRATMPRTLDDRIVIVDLDEKSLGELGHWPWGRNKLAAMMDELFDRQKVAVVGFDVVFAEADDSSGLQRLRQLAQGELKDAPGFVSRLEQIQGSLDYDALFAKSLAKRPVVMGYYFTHDPQGKGFLPEPVLQKADLQGRTIRFYGWEGYGSNIDVLGKNAPMAGFFNPVVDNDGVLRSIPLLSEYGGKYYETLSLAMYRLAIGLPTVEPGFPKDTKFFSSKTYNALESINLRKGKGHFAIPVDDKVASLIPYRGLGGVKGGSFRYVSAADVIGKRLKEGELKDRIILVGTTAVGLQDLRIAPVGETYPGVEAHANVISGLLDGKVFYKPDYAVGYDVFMIVVAGLVLALGLPLLSATRAVILSAVVIAIVFGFNWYLFTAEGLVLPLAAALVMSITAFALNMSYGYFVESRSKRNLAHLFGTYVPPELVDEMVKDPEAYSMAAASKELTVMFCDMRGFTKMSETMEPLKLQELLNSVFNRLTDIIRGNRGTIDKYMGDCVMAFWGAPVDLPNHAFLASKTSMEMANAVRKINEEHRAKGIPEIGVGIGLNTGSMCVGDMGSELRRAYTVIGDSVNLGSRLEGLSKVYGVDIVVSESTRKLANEFAWQELDRVRVKGKEQAVAIFWPLAPADRLDKAYQDELKTWAAFLKAYRAQDWDNCDLHLLNLQRMNPKKYLYELYSERVASMRLLPFDPEWDGATNFETK
ncbi:CHASE2 domain-containing protein [Ramlibacter sp. PS4R-6]|uniref:CHASE2 domain-containing protein n=1 Tax=Ramlibacter sp. PS4R-6 TaxID=3133438 RepID=UPI0030ABBD19